MDSTNVDRIAIVSAYRQRERLDVPPWGQLANCEPVYEEVRGWKVLLTLRELFSQLSPAARTVVDTSPINRSEIVDGQRRACALGDTMFCS